MSEDYTSFPDELLVLEIQEGSLLAFQALVRRYESRLLFFVRRIVWDEATAEEVVQDTFLKVYQAIHRVDLEQRFSTYLFTIAKHTAISALRTQRPEMPLDDAEQQPSPEDLNVTTDQVILSEQMSRVLQSMPVKYRQVVELYYFQNLSYEEIHARIGLPLNTVRTHLRRAKALIRSQFRHDQ